MSVHCFATRRTVYPSMHLSYTTSYCARHVALDTGLVSWKLVSTNTVFELVPGSEYLCHGRTVQCSSPDCRVVGYLDAVWSSPVRDGYVYHRHIYIRDEDDGARPYKHTIVDVTEPLRQLRCRRVCAVLLNRLRVKCPKNKDPIAIITRWVWHTKYDAAWDRE